MIVHESPLPLAPLGERAKGDGFETNASSNNQCSKLVKSNDPFFKEHFLDEPSIVDSSEVEPHMQLSDPNHIEFSLDLAPTPPISPPFFFLPHSSLFFRPYRVYFCRV